MQKEIIIELYERAKEPFMSLKSSLELVLF